MLRALCDPHKPITKTYKELSVILDTHYLPPVIIFRERLNFYTATKNPNESVTAWYARVKQLAFKCKFDPLDDYIRDRFIIGMANENIFDKLCEEDETLTLSNALKKALIVETKFASKTASPVNFVNKGAQRSNNRNNKNKGGNRGNSNNNNNSSNKGHEQKKECKHCGWKNHESSNCKFKQSTCHVCSRVGHLASVCRNKDKINPIMHRIKLVIRIILIIFLVFRINIQVPVQLIVRNLAWII